MVRPEPIAVPQDPAAETELKFLLTPEALETLSSHPALRGPGQSERLRSVYFDTPDHQLRDHGLSVRVRETPRGFIQTVKRRSGAGRVDRDEWEVATTGPTPNAAALRRTPVAAALEGELEKLKPLFATDVTRVRRYWTEADTVVEISLDQGEIIAGDHTEPILELEIELKQGEPESLFGLAKDLIHTSPVPLSYESKGERGYRLAGHDGFVAHKGGQAEVPPGTPAAEAFRMVARSALAQVAANAEILVRRRNPEALHQLRVGLRRLRAAYAMFKPLLLGEEAERLKEETRWLAGELNAARDLDVFIDRTFRPAEREEGDDPAFQALGKWLTQAQGRAYQRALAAVDSGRFARVLLDTVAWVEVGPWCRDPASQELREQPIEEFARPRLQRYHKRVRKAGRELRHLDPAARHELRIEAKKLRYAAEFFASAYEEGGRKRRAAYIGALKRFQDALGDLNDIAVARRSTAALVRDSSARLAYAAGVLVGRRSRDEAALLDGAEAAYQAFRGGRPFWDKHARDH
ncbi:MAG: CHAD domain-containing protein [Phenylobacterium sp.]|jgi:inorganic triphosphatase YgiF|uniref:CYTH and CHAD domain-containing protein n=1 Tax=Phenylobacterium sp. TaxID=1871053 RepID=UPI002A3621FC|nr:CHAD domain-containing protein [Phenylobacterium sp.]MDX9997421.1 CHAD domain-containing protein [Phenylobacterium sp.]